MELNQVFRLCYETFVVWTSFLLKALWTVRIIRWEIPFNHFDEVLLFGSFQKNLSRFSYQFSPFFFQRINDGFVVNRWKGFRRLPNPQPINSTIINCLKIESALILCNERLSCHTRLITWSLASQAFTWFLQSSSHSLLALKGTKNMINDLNFLFHEYTNFSCVSFKG